MLLEPRKEWVVNQNVSVTATVHSIELVLAGDARILAWDLAASTLIVQSSDIHQFVHVHVDYTETRITIVSVMIVVCLNFITLYRNFVQNDFH